MKFDCGETSTEKRSRLRNWHRWFAWHPVRLEDDQLCQTHDCRWLEYVERRGNPGSWWNYRALTEETK